MIDGLSAEKVRTGPVHRMHIAVTTITVSAEIINYRSLSSRRVA